MGPCVSSTLQTSCVSSMLSKQPKTFVFTINVEQSCVSPHPEAPAALCGDGEFAQVRPAVFPPDILQDHGLVRSIPTFVHQVDSPYVFLRGGPQSGMVPLPVQNRPAHHCLIGGEMEKTRHRDVVTQSSSDHRRLDHRDQAASS